MNAEGLGGAAPDPELTLSSVPSVPSVLSVQMSHTGEIKNCSQAVTGFFASMLTYPFVLVSNLMAVNNCGFRRFGNMSRGNSLFFRKLPPGKMYNIENDSLIHGESEELILDQDGRAPGTWSVSDAGSGHQVSCWGEDTESSSGGFWSAAAKDALGLVAAGRGGVFVLPRGTLEQVCRNHCIRQWSTARPFLKDGTHSDYLLGCRFISRNPNITRFLPESSK
ncbi:hypothetical protein FQN60_017386 [Etheostoma spectabile]|uniref:Uncharacterized protein n=1 Tax=Etheostoma spectabile TaxID=54343 RepID=A0A5J5DFA0_9PERO|nr:hypothetical protein FQN60_017386 [Etheostoma spectabile]